MEDLPELEKKIQKLYQKAIKSEAVWKVTMRKVTVNNKEKTITKFS